MSKVQYCNDPLFNLEVNQINSKLSIIFPKASYKAKKAKFTLSFQCLNKEDIYPITSLGIN